MLAGLAQAPQLLVGDNKCVTFLSHLAAARCRRIVRAVGAGRLGSTALYTERANRQNGPPVRLLQEPPAFRPPVATL